MALKRRPGLYEELLTLRLDALIEEFHANGLEARIDEVDPAEAPQVLARFVHDLLLPALDLCTGADRVPRQVALVNADAGVPPFA